MENNTKRTRKLCGITHVASKRYIFIIKGGINKIWAFFSSHGTSWCYFPFHSNLDESDRNFEALLMYHRYDIFQSLKVEKTKSEPHLVLLALFFDFIPILTNLNGNLWHYSCSIDIFWSLKVEKMKYEPFLVLLALFGAIFLFIVIWTNLDKYFWHYHQYDIF